MAALYKSKRVIFAKGEQKKFLVRVKNKQKVSWAHMAKFLRVSNRSLGDWTREKFSMPLSAVRGLSGKAGVAIPRNIEIRNPFWYVSRGAVLGGIALYRKYRQVGGDPEHRKKKWREWWEKKGRHQKHPIINVPLPINKPRLSERLAEFIGIVLGDGGISNNQVCITLHHIDDRNYSSFVIGLIKKLFKLKPSVYHSINDSVYDIVVSRVELVKFMTDKLGLKTGNKVKQQVDVPGWIKNNKKFQIACVRGLMDTDGSIFIHKYKVKDKAYQYKKMAFTSRSKPLVIFVYNALKQLKLNPRITKNGWDVRLDSIEDVKKYFRLIGSHNLKHLKKYKN